MRPLRVVRIPYLNSMPFYQDLDGAGFELADLPPRKLGAAAQAGAADAGIMSMCDTFRNPEFEPLGALGVSADGPAHSVLLFSRVEPRLLAGATIAVTTETSTSYPLLRLLLEQHFEVHAKTFVRRPNGPETSDTAVLLIGDAALRTGVRHGIEPGGVDYTSGLVRLTSDSEQRWCWALDLGATWKLWQGLPFVFARWVVRRGADVESSARLLSRVSSSLDRSLRDLEKLAGVHCAEGGLSPKAAFAYLMGFNYRLGGAEFAAIERFRALLAGSPWWEESRTPAFRESGA